MEYLCQEENPLLELIKARAIEFGWIKKSGKVLQTKLANEAGVYESAISRFFNGRGIDHKSLYLILNKLNLINITYDRKLERAYGDLAEARGMIIKLNNVIKDWETRWKRLNYKKKSSG